MLSAGSDGSDRKKKKKQSKSPNTQTRLLTVNTIIIQDSDKTRQCKQHRIQRTIRAFEQSSNPIACITAAKLSVNLLCCLKN